MSALRDTEGKLDWNVLFEYMPLAMQELCKARMFGARYYTKDGKDGRSNWLDSIGTEKHEEFMKGCVRGGISHDFKFLWGEERDKPQDDVHHLAFAALNNLFALEYALSGSSSEAGGSSQGSQDSDCVGSHPNDPSILDLDPAADFRKAPTLYDWSKIDDMYQWCATGVDGYAHAFENKPIRAGRYWTASQGWSSNPFKATPDLAESWQDSLEERPKV